MTGLNLAPLIYQSFNLLIFPGKELAKLLMPFHLP
jgi:hypothetical protein